MCRKFEVKGLGLFIMLSQGHADTDIGGTTMTTDDIRAKSLELALHFVDSADVKITLDENGRIVLGPKLFDTVKTVIKFITDGKISERRGNAVDVIVTDGNIRVTRGND
jgi:hypothetical protein